MKVFHCSHCQQAVFFANTDCVQCGNKLAFLPDRLDVVAIAAIDSPDSGVPRWSPIQSDPPGEFRLCENYEPQGLCNWAIPLADQESSCLSCRLTREKPDVVNDPTAFEALSSLEFAKRRAVYSLLRLGLPVFAKQNDELDGFAFDFLGPSGDPKQPVLTGHNNGVITISLAEADDAERERRRVELGEPYRTLLGHFRHEIGHYYWNILILRNPERLKAFRALFGDEQVDYSESLEMHYQDGPPPDWQQHFVSAYAASHPWEDWAESWAHYMHIHAGLEMAACCGVTLMPQHPAAPRLESIAIDKLDDNPFDESIDDWLAVSYALNNLNRTMGYQDAYPFVLTVPAIEKLSFIHDTLRAYRRGRPR